MSLRFLILLFAGLTWLAQLQAEPTSFRVATYNIRYDAKADEVSGNPWVIRKKEVADLIKRHQFDIVGTQEPNEAQLKELQGLLPDFEHFANPYGGKDGNAHYCATFFKKHLLQALDSGVFWFSETPDTPSIGWDATDRRICVWNKLQVKATGEVFFVFNAHFYWKNEIARAQSGPLLVNKMKSIAGASPAIALGDLNSAPDTPQIHAIKTHLSDAFDITKTARQGVEGTGFPGGVFQGKPNARIDYLFVTPHFTVKDYKVLSDVYNGDRYPSDHLPVTSLVQLTPKSKK